MLSYYRWSSGLNFAVKYFHSRIINSRCFCISKSPKSSIDPEEVRKFDSSADEWWNGKAYDLLRSLNAVRVPLVRDGILSVSKCAKKSSLPLKGYEVLDVGCGGGILSEPLARLGASVTGLDPGSENIQVATEHAFLCSEIKDKLNYVCDTVENFALSGKKFDAVVCSEVIEHVNDVDLFVRSCTELTKESGSLFFTTLNRTPISYFLSILMAEHVMNIVPKGTHDWNKFLKPSELCHILESHNCHVYLVQGISYNPLIKKFDWCSSNANMYALHAVK